jgi:Protein of unknown function (DUF2911)
MKTKTCFITLGALLAFVISLPSARAGVSNQTTKLTFSQPVQIPGHVLPAGTYWFELSNASSTGKIINIYNSDRSTVFATIITVNAESLTPHEKTTITFAERESMQPKTLVSWFYPGESTGHQFVYSPTEEHELAQVKHYTIMVKAQNKRQTAVSGD